MFKILTGVAIGILLSIAAFQIWNIYSKQGSSPAPSSQQNRLIQTSSSPNTTPIPSPITVQDYASFVAYVKSLGLGVGNETKAHSDLYSGDITEVLINGETMYVIEYPTQAEMDLRAAEISPDASTITKAGQQRIVIEKSSIPTHYYKTGKIIVIYAGRNESIVQILEEIFGEQFAGHD